VVGHGATIDVQSPSYKALITFDQSDLDKKVMVICQETTSGGMVSPEDTLEVQITKFKPMEFEEFIGTWSGVEVDGSGTEFDITVELTAGPGEYTVIFPATAGIPSLMSDLFANNWGETFQESIAPGGNLTATINLESGAVDIFCQYMGQTLPGPWDYWFAGSGTWEGFNKSMTITYGLQWDDACDTDYNLSTITLTKQ
jgi:hypothetical protein